MVNKLVSLHIPGSRSVTYGVQQDNAHLNIGTASSGRYPKWSGGGGGSISDKSRSAISKGVEHAISTPEKWGSSDDQDKEITMKAISKEVTKTYSWGNSMDRDDPSTYPPSDKPYATISFESGTGGNDYRPELKVSNSFGIKDDLKGRGFQYSDKTWYASGSPNDLKSEVDYLQTKGVVTKFGQSRFGKTHDILLGQTSSRSTDHTTLIKSSTIGSLDDGSAKIASQIERSASSFGIDQK